MILGRATSCRLCPAPAEDVGTKLIHFVKARGFQEREEGHIISFKDALFVVPGPKVPEADTGKRLSLLTCVAPLCSQRVSAS